MIRVLLSMALVAVASVISGCSSDSYPSDTSYISVLSISSDGNYVIANNKKEMILWDISNRTKKIISTNANIYSAYFIKNTDDFMWQDLNNIVHVQNVKGKELLSFPNFPTYGEVMTSDLNHYLASNVHWGVYENYGNKQIRIKQGFNGDGFVAAEKLLNLTLSKDDKLLLMSGYAGQGDKTPLSKGLTARDTNPKMWPSQNYSLIGGVSLWSVDSGKPLFKLPGNFAKTIATLSPDGNYSVTGDEDMHANVWNTHSGKLKFELDTLCCGRDIKIGNSGDPVKDYKWDATGMIPESKGYLRASPPMDGSVFALKFIDLNGDYLRFTTDIPNYSILYNINNPGPSKYIHLSNYPKTSISYYSQDESIDTAPAAHILVMAQQHSGNIVVYKYDPKTFTLTKIWAPGADGWYLFKLGFLSLILGAIASYLLLLHSKRWRKWLITCGVIALIIAFLEFYFANEWGVAVSLTGIAIGIAFTNIYFRKRSSTTVLQQTSVSV